MTNVVLIPARGGSKGVVAKNLRKVGGRSLIARTISAASSARRIDRVVVSTEDDAIAEEAKRAGADVLRRPTELASDRASSESVLLHALGHLDAVNVLTFAQCTAPFLTSADIDNVTAPVADGKADSAFAAVPHHGFIWRQDHAGQAVGVNHNPAQRPRRQDLEPEWLEAGSVYAMSAQGFLAARHRFFGRTVLIPIEARRAIEIDSEWDLELANTLSPHLDDAT